MQPLRSHRAVQLIARLETHFCNDLRENYANRQNVLLIHFLGLKINLFLEWRVCRLMTAISDRTNYRGFNRWG